MEVSSEKNYSKAVLATLAYYDVNEMALTRSELLNYCVNPKRIEKDSSPVCNSLEVDTAIDRLISGGKMISYNGYFMLPGRLSLYDKRIEYQKISDQKWKKLLKISFWLQMVPYMRAVFVTGSLAIGNVHKKSDLDLLIVTAPGRIWFSRFLISVLISLFGMRRKRFDKIAPDKICLNHYITEKSLKIPFKSLYAAQVYAHMIPIWSKEQKTIDEFERLNSWISEYVCDWKIKRNYRFRTISNSKVLGFIRRAGEFIFNNYIGDKIELLSGKIQGKRIKSNPSYLAPGGRIKVDESKLEFHPNSPELLTINQFNEKISRLPELSSYSEGDSGLKRG